jgi:hypothetical protein
VRSEEEVLARPGDRDVREAAFLGDGVVGQRPGEELEGLLGGVPVVVVGPAEPRQALAVAAQVVREGRQTDQPALVAGVGVAPAVADDLALVGRVGGEGRLDQPRDGDDVPLQPLGGVHRHHLHGVGTGLDPAEVEPALLVDGGLQPGQEAAQGGTVGAGREGRADVGERVEVGACRTGRVAGAREHLDVEAQRGLGLRHQLGQPEPGERAQPPHGSAQAPEPLQRGGRQRLALGADPGGRRQVVERLDDAGPLAGIG